jgi:excisionase family DNA binding protein
MHKFVDFIPLLFYIRAYFCMTTNHQAMYSKTLTMKDVIAITGLSRPTLYQFIRSGELICYRPSKRKYAFLESDVNQFILNSRVKSIRKEEYNG